MYIYCYNIYMYHVIYMYMIITSIIVLYVLMSLCIYLSCNIYVYDHNINYSIMIICINILDNINPEGKLISRREILSMLGGEWGHQLWSPTWKPWPSMRKPIRKPFENQFVFSGSPCENQCEKPICVFRQSMWKPMWKQCIHI